MLAEDARLLDALLAEAEDARLLDALLAEDVLPVLDALLAEDVFLGKVGAA